MNLDFLLGQDYINGLVLTGLIGVNIFLGSIAAILNKQFDKTKFTKGLLKGVCIAVAFFITYILGQFIPNVLVITSNGVDVNIQTAIGLLITGSLVWYGKEVILKLKNAIGGSSEVK